MTGAVARLTAWVWREAGEGGRGEEIVSSSFVEFVGWGEKRATRARRRRGRGADARGWHDFVRECTHPDALSAETGEPGELRGWGRGVSESATRDWERNVARRAAVALSEGLRAAKTRRRRRDRVDAGNDRPNVSADARRMRAREKKRDGALEEAPGARIPRR